VDSADALKRLPDDRPLTAVRHDPLAGLRKEGYLCVKLRGLGELSKAVGGYGPAIAIAIEAVRANLARQGGAAISQYIRDRYGLTRRQTRTALEKLESGECRKWFYIERPDPKDGRKAIKVHATPAGVKLLHEPPKGR
jgi:hypothetical protein